MTVVHPITRFPNCFVSDFQNPIVLLKYVAGRIGIEAKFIVEMMPICPTPIHPITRFPMQLVIICFITSCYTFCSLLIDYKSKF